MMMITFLDILTIIITIILLFKSHKFFTSSSLCLIHYTFVLLYVLPILMDYTLGFNDYSVKCIGFAISRNDYATSFVYDIFVIYVQFVLVLYKRNNYRYSYIFKHTLTTSSLNIPDKVFKFIWIGAVAAPIWMIINSAAQFLFFFQWRELRIFDLPSGYAVAECLSYIGISCSIYLVFKNVNSNNFIVLLQKLLAMMLLYVNICVQGKRAILFFALCNIIIILILNYYFKSNQSKTKKVFIRLGTTIAIILFSVYMISSTFETHSNRGYDDGQFTSARIDFFRDDRVRMAIYAEMNQDKMQITEHALQTLPDDLLSFFPLNFLVSRINRNVVMYQTRFTCAMSGESTTNITDYLKDNYSFMTVSFVAEIISNLGLFLGLLSIPFVLLWFVKVINNYPSPINILIFNSFFLLNLFDFSYVSYYLQLTLLLMFIYKRNKIVI